MLVYSYTTLNDPLATNGTAATGINNNGQIVGSYGYVPFGQGFLYSAGAYVTLDYNTANPPAFGTNITGINDAGEIVGFDYYGGWRAFVYTAGVYTPLDGPLGPTSYTEALGINNAGQILGYTAGPSPLTWVYSGGTYSIITGPSGAVWDLGTGINNFGQIVGYYTDSSNHTYGFFYNGSSYTTLNDPLATNGTFATGINDRGQIVGYYLDSSFQDHGFLYSGGTYSTLNDPVGASGPYTGTFAYGINNAGQIVGTYTDTSGVQHGFLANPVQVSIAQTTGILNERPFLTGSNALDYTSGVIAFSDPNFAHGLTVSILNQTTVYHDANGNVDTLTSAEISAFDQAFSITSLAGNSSGNVVDWSYSIGDKLLDFLGVGESTTVTTTIQIADQQGAAVAMPITVTIHGADDNPIANPDAASVQQAASITANAANGVLANDSDPDIHDTLSVSAVNGHSKDVGQAIKGAYGNLTLNADGSYTYVETSTHIPNNGAQDVFNYTISDGHGGTATSTLDISITPPPVATVSSVSASPASGEVGVGDTVVITLDLSEAVTVTGNPGLTLNDGGAATYDGVDSKPSSGVLVFDYTVPAKQVTSDLQVEGVSLTHGASITNVAGASANLGGAQNVNLGLEVNPPTLAEYYNASEAVYNDNAPGTHIGASPPASTDLTVVLDSRQENPNWESDGFFAQAFNLTESESRTREATRLW